MRKDIHFDNKEQVDKALAVVLNLSQIRLHQEERKRQTQGTPGSQEMNKALLQHETAFDLIEQSNQT